MICCCGTDAPARSHSCSPRHPVRSLSRCAGPHFSPSRYACREVATHWFHTHRHRSHSPSRDRNAVRDRRRR
ncbi:hypothetical protein E1288_31950 [Saccharopolyspora elongata]|uniref:Uncharacterized protein n=1 Tax=Saccharopolyspora elongata TaxID=2530387 RepID=A0A4R4YAL0_9PSEU|nr:hypothetical protein E1288_31950 [Saccharopolyspora elongata]